jgi:hypothetical protein
MGAVQACQNKCKKPEDEVDIVDIDEPLISKTPRGGVVKNKNASIGNESEVFPNISPESSRISHTLVEPSNSDMLLDINDDHKYKILT